jgi:hypothetical protein
MNLLREYYERVLLGVATAILFVCAVFIWRAEANFSSQFAVMPPAPALGFESPFAKSQELATALEEMHRSPQWTFGGRSGLFVPERHFIGANGLPATLQTTQVHPPVPNEWIEQFGLPIADADVLEQDPDNDGFNNLEEWVGHTKPTDPIHIRSTTRNSNLNRRPRNLSASYFRRGSATPMQLTRLT